MCKEWWEMRRSVASGTLQAKCLCIKSWAFHCPPTPHFLYVNIFPFLVWRLLYLLALLVFVFYLWALPGCLQNYHPFALPDNKDPRSGYCPSLVTVMLRISDSITWSLSWLLAFCSNLCSVFRVCIYLEAFPQAVWVVLLFWSLTSRFFSLPFPFLLSILIIFKGHLLLRQVPSASSLPEFLE